MRRILSITVAFAIAVLATIAARLYWPHDVHPMQRLADAAPAAGRDIEPRLSGGFRWAPLRRATRGADDSSKDNRLRLAAVAAETIRNAARDRHAAAVAELMLGRASRAAKMFEPIAGSNAGVWCDLAAARYEIAIHEEDPSYLPRALAAADAALRLEPHHAAARFNRALVLERLGLRNHAREQWNAYLAVDSGSDWANEARQHVRELQPIGSFREVLVHSYERLASDAATAHLFARQHRQDSRLWGETEILGRWATEERNGDHELARKHLSVARALATELERDRGDKMLYALVAALDRADNEQRKALVTAHLAFRDGQKTYQNDRPADAEKIFLGAAEAFDRGKSPGALLARYFAANTAFSQGRVSESRDVLEKLLNESPREYMAHRAQVLWQMGINDLALADWGRCIDVLSDSVEIFERLDERTYAANVRQVLATAYERIGDATTAWKHRMLALRELGQRPSGRLEIMLRQLARVAAANGDWQASASLFSLALDAVIRVDDPLVTIETLTHRAKVYLRMNDRTAASRDVNDARAQLHHAADPAYRALLETNLSEIEAALSSDPAVTVAILTKAIGFHQTKGFRMRVPELLLERGRAYRSMRDERRAANDFEAGVEELESRRNTVVEVADRSGFFYDAGELFAEAITLALDERQPERAFRYVERARARTLLEELGTTLSAVTTPDVADDSIIIEYAVQPGRVIIFAVDGDGVRAFEHRVDRATLLGEAAELTRALMSSDRIAARHAGSTVYRRLIEPVAMELTGKESIVFVPDPAMATIPFAALVDGGGKYLIERHTLVIAPSAAVHARLGRVRRTSGDPQVLVITGSEEAGRLSAAQREADLVQAIHRHARRLPRALATRAAFRREAAEADLIHFVGHSVESTAGGRAGALLLNDGRLVLNEIASMRLPRTSLVVLAACSTAAGETRAAEGTLSVARAFLAAGVPTVVATLWPVEDEESAGFFPVVHHHIARGLTAAEALRAAQIEWIRKGNASSALWAAVQVIGNGERFESKR